MQSLHNPHIIYSLIPPTSSPKYIPFSLSLSRRTFPYSLLHPRKKKDLEVMDCRPDLITYSSVVPWRRSDEPGSGSLILSVSVVSYALSLMGILRHICLF